MGRHFSKVRGPRSHWAPSNKNSQGQGAQAPRHPGSDAYGLHPVGGRRVRPAGWMARIGWSARLGRGLAQGCRCALPLQAWAGAYRGGRPHLCKHSSVMVTCRLTVAASKVGKTSVVFVDLGAKVDSDCCYYWHSDTTAKWARCRHQDGAPSHTVQNHRAQQMRRQKVAPSLSRTCDPKQSGFKSGPGGF